MHENDVTAKRFIPAPPEVVFRLWTEPEHLKRWWGPAGVTCTEAHIDLTVGGVYKLANQFPSGDVVWIHGVFLEIQPPNALVYSWAAGLENPPNETVTITFVEAGGGTNLTVLHQNVPSPSMAKSHENGWVGCLVHLEGYANTISGIQ